MNVCGVCLPRSFVVLRFCGFVLFIAMSYAVVIRQLRHVHPLRYAMDSVQLPDIFGPYDQQMLDLDHLQMRSQYRESQYNDRDFRDQQSKAQLPGFVVDYDISASVWSG